MRMRSIFWTYLLFLPVILIIVGCSTKGLDYEAAMREFEAGKYEEARKAFEAIAKEGGKYANRANFYVGECYKYQFKWDEATAAFQKVIDAEPTTYLGSEARNRIAQIREGRNDVQRLTIIYGNNPGTEQAADALLELGSVYDNKLNDYNKAIETYRQVIKEFPGTAKAAQAQVNIGYLYLYKIYDYNQAFVEFNKVNAENYPTLKYRVTEVQDLLRNVNKTREEIATHIAFIAQNQKTKILPGRKITGYDLYGVKQDQVAQSFVAVAIKWRSLKNYPEALNAYRICIERLPLVLAQAAESRYGIAEIYMEQHRYLEAVDAFEEYIKYHPTHFRRPEAVYNMAICYESLRDYDKAYEYYKIYRDTYRDKENFKAADLKVRQYEYDEDQDGYAYYKELQAGTSDTDPNRHP